MPYISRRVGSSSYSPSLKGQFPRYVKACLGLKTTFSVDLPLKALFSPRKPVWCLLDIIVMSKSMIMWCWVPTYIPVSISTITNCSHISEDGAHISPPLFLLIPHSPHSYVTLQLFSTSFAASALLTSACAITFFSLYWLDCFSGVLLAEKALGYATSNWHALACAAL